jgi:Flp pilus assembly protein TadG
MLADLGVNNGFASKSVLKNQRGVALIEAAFIMIPFLLLLLGIIEFSLYLYNQQVINNAAREGARAGIVVQVPRMSEADIKTKVLDYAEKKLVTFGPDKLTSEDIAITKIIGPKNTGTWGKFDDILIVSASYEYQWLFLSNFGIPKITLDSSNSASRMELE